MRLPHALLLPAAWTIATAAHASYGQMRLDGIGLMLAFVLTVGYGLLVDGALYAGLFRRRAALVAGWIAATLVAAFLFSQLASPAERAGFFKGPGVPELVVVVMTSAVFVPFIFIAPFGQYRALRAGGESPPWITAWMVMQFALLPGFVALGFTEEVFRERDVATGQAEGSQVSAGGFPRLVDRAAQKRERIWGTGWTYPWPEGTSDRSSAWLLGLARGLDASAPIAANAPLSEPDRAALQTLMEKYLMPYGVPQIRTKLLWDVLEPGRFARELAPHGVDQGITVSEEVIPVLIERLEKDGAARLCPGGRLMDADRAVLTALVMAKVRLYDEAHQREVAAAAEQAAVDREMAEAPFPYGLIWKAERALEVTYAASPILDWDGYRKRVERLCPGPAASAGSGPPAAG